MVFNKSKVMKISFIVPAYNEEKAAPEAVRGLKFFLEKLDDVEFEIIVVNDGSTDKTGEFLKEIEGIKLIEHPYNKGYGASIKTGVKNAKFDWVFFFDADGQPRPEEIPNLLKYADEFDMVVGARTEMNAPLIRQPGRKFLNFMANYLAEKKIPDINCGFRVVKKEKIEEFWHLLPDSFSLTTTITLAFLKSGLNIKYVPIQVNKRAGGKSMVKPKHAIRMFFLIFRTIILFSPLRVFIPAAGFLFLLGTASFIYDLSRLNLGDTTVLLFVASLIIFLFGLMADQLSAIRREIHQ